MEIAESGAVETTAADTRAEASGEAVGGIAEAPDGEENIYDTMKRHMREKQAAMETQRRAVPSVPVGPQTPARIDVVTDVTDLAAVWLATRTYLSNHARYLESVLGPCTTLLAISTAPPEVTVAIPNNKQNFTNEKAQAKLEEAFRTVTALPLRIKVNFTDPPPGEPNGTSAGLNPNHPNPPLGAAQRIAPEVMNAIKNQPIVQELMKRFDATVTQVEVLDTAEAEPD